MPRKAGPETAILKHPKLTMRRSPHYLQSVLLPLAVVALGICPSCAVSPRLAPNGSQAFPDRRKPPNVTAASPSTPRQPQPTRADSRYRPATNFSELQAVAGAVAKTSDRKIRWHLALGNNPGPLAKIRGGLDDCTIFLHPVAARTVPPNTWAFIFGHEFAHRVEGLGNHSQTNPSNELKADIAGARYAMAAGYRLEAFLGWVLTEPNQSSATHGSLRERVRAIAAHFGIPQNVIQAEAQRYSRYRAAH